MKSHPRHTATRRRIPAWLALGATLGAFWALSGPSVASGPPPAGSRASSPAPGRFLVQTDSLLGSVRWLADDAREGRMTGSPGAEAAAAWISDRFAALGLEPAGNAGGYRQWFEARLGTRPGRDNALSLDGVEGLTDLLVPEDFLPFGFSESGSVDVPLVFAGYGITDEKLGYDDYAGLEVAGKAVLVVRHEPQQDDPGSVFNGDEWSRNALYRTKAQNARDHGAAALILFTGPRSPEYRRDRLTPTTGAEGIGGGDLLAVHVRKEVGEILLAAAGVNLHRWIDEVDGDLQPRSFAFEPEVRVRLRVSVRKDRQHTANLVGILPGTDPEAGAVFLGAHYDHLGYGNSSSMAPDEIGEVHNGADDNASGVAALLELARVFSVTEPTRRSLVFAAFTGEELGLLGSEHMVDHLPVDPESIQAMINLDMVGRPEEKTLAVGGLGTSPELVGVLERATESSYLTVIGDLDHLAYSDHTPFKRRDIPVLFFFSGLHGDYHTPDDDWEKIDPRGITEITRIVHDVALELANRPDRISPTPAPVD